MECLYCKEETGTDRKKYCNPKCWNKCHPKESQMAKKKYMERVGKEYMNSLARKWRKRNPESVKATKRRQKVIEMSLHSIKHKARRHDYKKRDDKCGKCGSTKRLEFHHENYETGKGKTLCEKCHKALHVKMRMVSS